MTMWNSQAEHIPIRHLYSSMSSLSGKSKPYWITGHGLEGINSWLSGQDTHLLRIAGNRWKGWNMRKEWCKHGGWTTYQVKSFLYFRVSSLLVLTGCTMGWKKSRIRDLLTEAFGTPTQTLNTIVQNKECFLCVVENKVLFCFRDVTGAGYRSCFMFCFKYRLILHLFYVLFQVSFDTRFVLCFVLSIVW